MGFGFAKGRDGKFDPLSHETPASFTGIVVPIEWDEDGNPLSIAIATEDEQEYRIVDDGRQGRALRKLLRRRVRITGTLGESENVGARAAILVSSFKLLEDRF
mgnify:CR=1 FL=1